MRRDVSLTGSDSLKLSSIAAKILNALAKSGGKADVNQLAESLKLDQATVVGESTSLSESGLVTIQESSEEYVRLTREGAASSKTGLPERIIIDHLVGKKGGTCGFETIKKELRLTDEDAAIALGWLKKKSWASSTKEDGRLILRASAIPQIGSDEEIVSRLSRVPQGLLTSSFKPHLRDAVILLQKRKLVEITTHRIRMVAITDRGQKILMHGVVVQDMVTQLTPDMIRSGDWRNVTLKAFDVSAPVEPSFTARYHPVVDLMEEVREVFLTLGFEEIKGNLVESAFWNFDALFQPQDHPAREMHDTFYLSSPPKAKLPSETIVQRIAHTHENGWETGSVGWGYKWSKEIAQQTILRTHTTATTIKYLASHPDPPVKVFSIDRVFRNEKVNYRHLAEFHQVEGIVMDKDVSLRNLMGVIKELYNRLGFPKVRFWPSYFPYTEPSAEAIVYVERKVTDQYGRAGVVGKWLELGGMGIFRPEVSLPLGIKYPVLAWGLGLERLLMIRLDTGDIRIPYMNQLSWMRAVPQKQ